MENIDRSTTPDIKQCSKEEGQNILKEAHTSTNQLNIKMNESSDESPQRKKSFLQEEQYLDIQHKQIYGTTLYIGEIDVEMVFGKFKVFVYQNLITKGMVMAFVYGNIHNDVLYTRIHSSCVTSETMRSLDCDCVLQLEGALSQIVKKGNGIFFYLIQEGRGCGYVGKSRACMIEQFTKGKCDTFNAYSYLGMKKDYREYDSIKDILKLQDINPKFVLMTNNPDKINAMKSLGINIISTGEIEFKPNPFNSDYLAAKAKSGHFLIQAKKKPKNYDFPFDPIQPFEPYQLKNAPRFIHVSSYYLPVKPVKYRCIVYSDDLQYLQEKYHEQIRFTELHNGKFIAQIAKPKDQDYDSIINQPYWVNVNVYYDVQSSQDYIVLVYKDVGWESRVPIVRIQSESLLNRFPLKNTEFKNYYKESLKQIVNNGYGMIVIFHYDGKGHGFGNVVLNYNATKQQRTQTGIDKDGRDYLAAVLLLQEKLQADCRSQIDLLYTTSFEQEKTHQLIRDQGITIRSMQFIGNPQSMGIQGFEHLINKIKQTYTYLSYPFKIDQDVKQYFNKNQLISVTGIGSSEAHARYLQVLLQEHTDHNCYFVPVIDFYKPNFKPEGKLIIFTQGLSENTHICFQKYDYKDIILFTSVGYDNQIPDDSKNAKHLIINKLKKDKSNLIITFPKEDEYECLIRLIGPLCAYMMAYLFITKLSNKLQFVDQKCLNQIEILRQNHLQVIDENFLLSLIKNKNLLIVSGMRMINYLQNLKYKCQEGMFLNSVEVKSYVELVHGTYQNMEDKKHRQNMTTNILILRSELDGFFYDKLIQMLGDDYPIITLNSELSEFMKIIEYELWMNHLVGQYVERVKVNQSNWYGKEKQQMLQNLYDYQP